MRMTFAEIVRVTGSAAAAPEGAVERWSIDTRTLEPGALYIALAGEVYDGHRFLDEAAERGAEAALVALGTPARGLTTFPVWDTLTAMQDLARHARLRLPGDVIAVTGSAGKTTTKDTIAALLGGHLRVGKNEGNLNNHIGVPLSLLRQSPVEQAYVFELGMNHAGEIRLLASLTRPDIAVVTNVGSAHIENFGAREGIAHAKRELVESLSGDGIAVINADDPLVAGFGQFHPGRTVSFGIEQPAEFRAEEVEMTAEGSRFRIGGMRYETPLAGRHGVLNVTAAVAVGSLLGVPAARMVEQARALKPGRMRGERLAHRGMTILNDSYNSNPEAAKAMLDYAAALPARRRIAVLGEMLELGAWAGRLHREVGEHAAAKGFDLVIAIRGAAAELAEGARAGGVEALFFATPEEAGAALTALGREGDLLLFKGSRGTRVEKALERFMAD